MNTKIEAVFLDAGGVFLLPNENAIVHELSAAGIEVDNSRLARAHYAGMRGVDLDLTGDKGWAAYNAEYLGVLGVTDASGMDALERAFRSMEWDVVISESLAAMSDLAASGLHLAVVSNSDGTVERLLRSLGIAQVGAGDGTEVITVIDSHVVGVAKPNPAIFEHALDVVGVTAENAIHVGDSVRFDVLGARAAGVRPLHLDPFDMCGADDHEHIASLAAVLDAL